MNRTKVFYLFIAIVITLFAAAGCSANSSDTQEPAAPTETQTETTPAADTAASDKTFTLDELKAYDGQNGNPAYVAVDGVVYDVTNAKGWNDGKHKGQTAGTDLTDAIGSAPHGTSALDGLPVVGTLE